MTATDTAIEERKVAIKKERERIRVLLSHKPLFDKIEEIFPEGSLVVTDDAGKPSAHIHTTVHNLATEALAHLEALGDLGLAVETWTSVDYPDDRRRAFWNPSSDPFNIFLNCHIADDSACRIEVIGYVEQEVYQQVRVKTTVPKTMIVCGGEE